MNLEQSLAAKKLNQLLNAGYTREASIKKAARFLETQGFSKEHSQKTASYVEKLI